MAALLDDTMADEESSFGAREILSHQDSCFRHSDWAANLIAFLVDFDPSIWVELCKIGRTRMPHWWLT